MERTVLIVEDDKLLQLLYEQTLKKLDFDLYLSGDGEDAIRYLESHTPALVFLDMRLPRVNGVAVLDYIRSQARLQSTRVVVTSASKDYERDAKPNEFMLKPVRPSDIVAIAEQALRDLS